MLPRQIPDAPIESQVGGADFYTGNTSDNDLSGKVSSWAVRYRIIRSICLGLAYLHEKSSTFVIPLDLKPQNILLDDCCVHKISGFGISRLLHGSHNTALPMVRAASTHNSPCYVESKVAASARGTEIRIGSHVIRVPKYSRFADTSQLLLHGLNCSTVETTSASSAVESLFFSRNNASEAGIDNDLCDEVSWSDRLEIVQGNKESYVEFAVAASAKGGTEIKIGSHVIQVPKYLSVHHPLVQLVWFACNMLDGTFACFESMVPKSIFEMAKRLRASALSNWCKTAWNSTRPKSESPKVGTVSDFSTGQSIVRRNELSENETHPSDTDASGAAWVAATAAPHHATGNRDLLAGFIIEHDDLFVHAVDGVSRRVLARGAVITDSVVLPDVWFVPGLTENLVSVSQLVELDHSVGFSCGKCCIRRTDGKVIGKGCLQDDGLYVLDFLKVPLYSKQKVGDGYWFTR